MFNKSCLFLFVLWLGGCAVQPTSTVEPAPRPGTSQYPSSGQYPAGSSTNKSGTTPAPSPVRKAPVVASYSENSTGVSAADALLREGKSYYQRGEYASAANSFERAIRMAPRSPALYLALAKTRLALNDYNNAIQMANRALSLLPSEGWGVDDARADAWNIIADGRAAAGNKKGADEARAKAREYM